MESARGGGLRPWLWLCLCGAAWAGAGAAEEEDDGRFAVGLLAVLPTLRPATTVVRAARRAAPDLFLGLEDRVREWGYPFEAHTVRTEDGYLLTAHRIPTGRAGVDGSSGSGVARPPVLMQHGVFGCSEQWVVGGPGISPDNWYYVWLTNSRGNDYSKKHENLT